MQEHLCAALPIACAQGRLCPAALPAAAYAANARTAAATVAASARAQLEVLQTAGPALWHILAAWGHMLQSAWGNWRTAAHQ